MYKILRQKMSILITVLVLVFLFGNSGFRKMLRRYWEIHKLSAEIDQSKKESSLLKKEIYYLEQDSSYIEQVARRELGMIAPGEIEYRFKNSKNNTKTFTQ